MPTVPHMLPVGDISRIREIHPLDPQPHRHSMLVPRVCAPRVTRCSLGKYWSRDFGKQAAERLTGWLAAYTDCHPI